MQALVGERNPSVAFEERPQSVIGAIALWINEPERDLPMVTDSDTTPFPEGRIACIFKMHFPISTEGKVCISKISLPSGSLGGFAS
jgi:hypothetical protein